MRNKWFCGHVWSTGCSGDGYTDKEGTICDKCRGPKPPTKTQMEVAKEHLAKLESLVYWFHSLGHKEAILTVCPYCNRDAVRVEHAQASTQYIDDCTFLGTHWKMHGYCRDTFLGWRRRVFKHDKIRP